ncbi:DNA-formamidopyrimidine glycosylase family protein [Microbacterium sp. B2969]|uniref:DNA-formamidopyrimidine glycosylase family protein n=1 Tax=Microbacterium alkaliflavum TaxID=3248839 RepID=A0ABW7Q8D5_9MICO
MPESPEVQALAEFLGDRLTGRRVDGVDLIEFRALKTRARPLTQLVGAEVVGASRVGKHVDLRLTGANLVVSLGRHGWMRWSDEAPAAPDPEAPPALAAFVFDDGGVLEATDAGDWVSLGLSVVDDALEVPAIAKLGPDPADDAFTRADFDKAVAGRRKQIKAILQEQESLSGIGNAYSDEILHAAKVSPVAHAAALDDAALDRVFAQTLDVVRGAIAARRGIPIDQLKAAKTAAMRVHGRAGEPCPVCGDTIREFTFASTTAEYCPTCQTGGVEL